LAEFVPVVTASQMAEAMKKRFPEADLTILCAAVADYRPKVYSHVKCKKSEGPLILELERTEDIALTLGGMKKSGQILVGFAAETDQLERYALEKLRAKNLDWIAANLVGVPGSGFASDTNTIKLYGADGSMTDLGSALKTLLADQLIRTFSQNRKKGESFHGK
jgi:phosphopantothenoylcysteine decarboxylase/phosphopantothenate--cysteine ligase